MTRVILTSDRSNLKTNYFDCPLGVKQGDILSPTLFSIFVNSLTIDLKNSDCGVTLDLPPSQGSSNNTTVVNHLIYADDLVCIAENVEDLQSLINIVNLWCRRFHIEANLTKTEILHVRNPSVPQSKRQFKFGAKHLCKSYKDLGLTIDQHLDPASRALSAVICKMIKNQGFPFSTFEMLYNCCVTSITDYGHDVIGFHQYSGSALIHSKANRAYLGVRQLPDDRLTKKIYRYDQLFMQNNPNLQCFSSEIRQILCRNNLIFSIDAVPPKLICKNLENVLLEKDILLFKTQCSKSPKLHTHNSLFSVCVDHKVSDSYTRLCLPFIVRKRLSQLRLGVLPLRIETDRFSRVKVDAKFRFCRQPKCKNCIVTTPPDQLVVENEFHFLMYCKQYDNLRSVLFSKLSCPHFDQMNDQN